ncbi:MAG: hypothetical protein IJ736_15575 [Firmicutes bacterium]|nr:hypothetical protein [Bacillota bacterium]MBR1738398.1 hypothetical protein [Bacillota bacterium]
MNTTAEIMDTGITCLIEKLGTVETERFISVIIRERSDYTKWRRKYFGDISSQEFNDAAVKYAEENPFNC